LKTTNHVISRHVQQSTVDSDETPKAQYKITHILSVGTLHNTQT